MTRALLVCGLLLAACSGAGLARADAGADSPDWAALRERMVREQLRGRDIRDERVLAIMGELPRHAFVPAARQADAYADRPLPIGRGQTISQPYVVALMTQLLALGGTERVLEIGTGSGYQAAVLARLAKRVYSIEIDPVLAEEARQRLAALEFRNVEVRAGDGFFGWPEAAPFDAILITAAAPRVPERLVAQLREGGVLVLPLGETGAQKLMRGVKREGKLELQSLGDVFFVPMTGAVREPHTPALPTDTPAP